jgi:glycosyltransferase involved in cell wall biosynthesis
MKILVVSNLYPPHVLGGYEILCAQVVDRLERAGHECVVLASDHGGSTAGPSGARVHRRLRLDVPFGQPPSVGRRLRARVGAHNEAVAREVLAAERPDVVYVWSQLRITLGAARAAHRAGLPVVYNLNDDHLQSYVPRTLSGSPLRLALAVADRTVFRDTTLAALDLRFATCISEALRGRLVELGIPVAGAEVIHQGIPLERFPVKAAPGSLHRPLRLLYVGQVHPYKGVHTMLQASDLLAARLGPDRVRVTVVGSGDGEYERSLRARAAAGRVPTRFVARVPQAELPEIYRDHDVLVFPSCWEEPFGLTHLEAMASGTTVVSTRTGGTRELVRDGENALAFAAEDPGDLARCLGRLVAEPDLSARLAARARRDAVERYSVDRYAADLEALLYRSIGAGRGAEPGGAAAPGSVADATGSRACRGLDLAWPRPL